MKKESIERFEYLDGLRGGAALLVVIGHFHKAFFDIQNNENLFKNIWSCLDLFFLTGHFCVQIFFVLSGFVLAYNSFNRTEFLNKQWTKRVVRLVSPVFITSIIYFLFSKFNFFYFNNLILIYHTEWAASHWNLKYSNIQFVIKFLYDFMFFADWQFGMNINSSLWTIPIELYWSYLLFIIIFIINKIKGIILKNIFYLVYSILLILNYTFIGKEYSFLFLGGGFIALNYFAISHNTTFNYLNIILLLGIFIISFLYQFNYLAKFELKLIKWESIIAILFLICVLRLEYLKKFFSIQIMKWLGRISFSLYLLHILVIASISAKMYIYYLYLRNGFGLIILLFFTIFVSCLIAHVFTIYIDEPLMKQFDKYYKKIYNAFK